MPKLTKRFVEAVKPGPQGTAVWDDEMPDFGLRVYPFGKRRYIVQYRARAMPPLHDRSTWHLNAGDSTTEAKALLGRVALGQRPG